MRAKSSSAKATPSERVVKDIRRATRRQLEQRRLVHLPRAEAPDENRHAQPVAAYTCRGCHFEAGTFCCPDGTREHAERERWHRIQRRDDLPFGFLDHQHRLNGYLLG